jgi:nicotinate-nucleotide adenylyltransferase
VTAAADRLDMVRAGIQGVAGLEASDMEITRGGPSYTADTLDHLAQTEPEAELFVIVGADLAGELDSWVRVGDIQKRAGLIVVSRPGHAAPDLPGWSVTPVAIPPLDISSTDLRRWAADGAPLDGLTPPPVIRLIAQRGLYAGAR